MQKQEASVVLQGIGAQSRTLPPEGMVLHLLHLVNQQEKQKVLRRFWQDVETLQVHNSTHCTARQRRRRLVSAVVARR